MKYIRLATLRQSNDLNSQTYSDFKTSIKAERGLGSEGQNQFAPDAKKDFGEIKLHPSVRENQFNNLHGDVDILETGNPRRLKFSTSAGFTLYRHDLNESD